MFAFAIWDSRRRKLLLARDRFGQKPLFWRFDGRRFLFGSEIKAILAAGGPDGPRPELDLRSLDEYLTLRFIPSPRTLFQGIRKLPPAHLLVLDASHIEPSRSGSLAPAPAIEVRRYWRLRYTPKRSDHEAEIVEEAGERIREAVESHMISDVPVGAYLSGGMDSSLVVAMMADDGGDARRADPDLRRRRRRPAVQRAPLRQDGRRALRHPASRGDGLARHGRAPAVDGPPSRRALGPDRRLHVSRGLSGLQARQGGAHRRRRRRDLRRLRPLLRLPLGEPLRRAAREGPALSAGAGGLRHARQLRLQEHHPEGALGARPLVPRGGRRYAQATAFFRFGQEGKGGSTPPTSPPGWRRSIPWSR